MIQFTCLDEALPEDSQRGTMRAAPDASAEQGGRHRMEHGLVDSSHRRRQSVVLQQNAGVLNALARLFKLPLDFLVHAAMPSSWIAR